MNGDERGDDGEDEGDDGEKMMETMMRRGEERKGNFGCL